ncbi:MAG TPA: phytoene/squalene synthase family protein [Solirubrobacteraceae bacterium]|nr:phytoene/squalene synthase family protein [Solirubrobacteraceae bacterium]
MEPALIASAPGLGARSEDGPGPLDVLAPSELARARAVTEAKATTFAIACRLLPKAIRDDVYRLYLVFRTLDDLVDDADPRGPARVAAVRGWARGEPVAVTEEVASLSRLAQRYVISRRAVEDFCLGMEQDLDWRGCADERELDRYCYRVAGTVGLVMSALLGCEDPDAAGCAVALGMAMQRTNILRDIDEDLRRGRVYISAEALARHGGSLSAGERSALMNDQITRADDLYRDGLAGVRTLAVGQLAVRFAAAMYREILREIERRDRAGLGGRAVVSGRRKAAVAARVLLTTV